ncbi:hypothetical protein TcWFU_009957 [Taenia crassiceps]|uniref:Uncharacterized protein n=1 Tax=Taenia crassiceps TaxID=6207 RepID=A0ABR4Q8Q8_9CEST
MDLTQRCGRNYRHHGYDCWTEDQIRKQLCRLRLFPDERFMRATTSTGHRQETEACDSHILTYAFGDILWIPKAPPSIPPRFGVNLTRIRRGSQRPWSTNFCAEILKVCVDALVLFPTDIKQANERIYSLLNLRRDSGKPVGWLYPANQWAVPVGLFCPQTCSIRRSIVIVRQRGLRKEALLKYIWALAPDAFHIPSSKWTAHVNCYY